MKKHTLLILAFFISQIAVAQAYRDIGLGFHDGLSVVKGRTSTKGPVKYGFVNKNNKLVIPLKYDDARSFNEGMASVKKGYLWGYVNTTGKEVVPFKYDFAHEFKNGFGVVGIADQGTGCVNKNGKLIIPCIYESINHFYDSKNHCDSKARIVYARLKDKYYVFDETGKEILPASYEFNEQFTTFTDGDDSYYFIVTKDGKYGVINEHGDVTIPVSYDKIATDSENRNLTVMANGKYGVLDMSGNTIVPVEFDEINPSYDLSKECALFKVFKNDMFGYYDINGKETMPVEYQIIGTGIYGRQIIVRHNGKYGIKYQDGPSEQDIDCEYDTLFLCKKEFIASKNGRFGIIDDKGTPKVAFEFDNIQETDDGIILTKDNLQGFYRWLDPGFKELLPCQYQEIIPIKDENWPNAYRGPSRFRREDHFFVKQNDKWGIIDNQGNAIIDCTSTMMPLLIGDGFICDQSRKVGVITISQKEIIPFKYEFFEPSEGMIRVKKDELYDFVTDNHKSMTEKGLRDILNYCQKHQFQYEDAKDYHDGLAAVKIKDKWGYIDNEGDLVIKANYSEASDFIDGKALVTKGSKEYYIDKEGKKLK